MVVLAPGVAALAGAGAVELWSLGLRRRWPRLAPARRVAGTAVLSAVLLGRRRTTLPGWRPPSRRVGGGRPSRRPFRSADGSPGGRSFAGASGSGRRGGGRLCGVALLAGPFAYSASTISRAITGNTAAAGPGAGLQRSSGSGSPASPPAARPPVDEGLIAYLDQNQGDAKYLVAVQATAESVPIILATGEPVVTIGGYKSRDPYPSSGTRRHPGGRGRSAVASAADEEDMSSSSWKAPNDERQHHSWQGTGRLGAGARHGHPGRARCTAKGNLYLVQLRACCRFSLPHGQGVDVLAVDPRATSRSLYKPPRKLAEQSKGTIHDPKAMLVMRKRGNRRMMAVALVLLLAALVGIWWWVHAEPPRPSPHRIPPSRTRVRVSPRPVCRGSRR